MSKRRKPNGDNELDISGLFNHGALKGKTEGQEEYLEVLQESVITLCAGPAGCGKSHLAIGLAAKYLIEGLAKRIILVRPIMESGEKLGALPGEIGDKVAPFMLPFYDILENFVSKHQISKWEQEERIVVSPLAYMRGITFKNCFVIGDELQNAKMQQLKMLLTRLGDNCKMALCGDVTQSDFEGRDAPKANPFMEICKKLRNIDERIQLVTLTEDDVVRHELVKKIIRATSSCK